VKLDFLKTLLESEIDEKYVDWIDTIALNAHPIYKEECEIRLFKNTPVKIKKIEIGRVIQKGKYFDKPQIIDEKHPIFKKIFSKIYYG